MSNGNFRKRILVTEGNLLQLWYEIEQVRKEEKKQEFAARFKQLLKEAELVNLQIVKKGANNG